MKKYLPWLSLCIMLLAPLAGLTDAGTAAESTAAAPAPSAAQAAPGDTAAPPPPPPPPPLPTEAGDTAIIPPAAPVEEVGGTAATAEGPRLKVLTFNTWCIISARERDARAEAMGRKIAQLDPDIAAIEEMFEARHRELLMKSLARHGYRPESRYFRRLYGSGILLLSKFPIRSALFEPYRVNSQWYNIERIGGKGIAYLDLETPWGRLDFFITHALSRSTRIFDEQGNFIPGDPLQVDRLLQMYQIDRFVRVHHSPLVRSLIIAGDFNVSPEMLEYQLLIRLSGLESSFEIMNPGQNPSTFCRATNMYVPDDFSRIDHILFKNFAAPKGFWIAPALSRVEMSEKFAGPGGDEMNYSDHYGIYSEFAVLSDAAAVKMSGEGRVPGANLCAACVLAANAFDAGEGRIALTPETNPVWADYAFWVIGEAYRHKDRANALVVPMAELLAADPAAPAEIKLDARAQAELNRQRCPEDCKVNELRQKPRDESLKRKLQSFSPWNGGY